MMIRTVSIFAVLVLLATNALATEVLGFEISATTLSNFLERSKGDPTLEKISASDRYTVHGYTIKPNTSSYPGLKRAAFMFDSKDRLCLVYLELPKASFDAAVQDAKTKYEPVGSSSSPDGSKDAYFRSGTDRVSIETKADWPSVVIMLMNEGYKKDSDARIRANGFRPKYE